MARGGRSPAARKALARRVDELLAEYDLAALQLGIPEEVADEVWQGVEHDAFFVDRMWPCIALSHAPIDAARAATLAEHLVRARPESAQLALVPCWSVHLDALVMRAYTLQPEAFDSRAERLPAWAQRGLALVQRRRGRSVPAELAAEVALALAATFPAGGPFGSTFAYVDAGRELSLTIENIHDLRRFAALVDAETAHGAAWSQALSRSVGDNRWYSIDSVAPVLQEIPLERLVEQLAARRAPSDEEQLAARSILRGRSPELAMPEAVSLLRARADPAEELTAAAERLASSGADSARAVTTLLVSMAASRAATNAAVAPTAAVLERLVSLEVTVDHRVLTDLLIAAARALPAESVRAWAQRAMPESAAAAVLLAAHFDRALFDASLREGPPPSPRAVGSVGAPALAPLLAANAVAASDEARQAQIRHGLVFVLDEMVRAGTPPDEALDLELLVAAFEGRPLERAEYRHTMQAATERIFRAMPVERRRPILREARAVAPMSVSAMLPSTENDAELDEWLGHAIRHGHVNSLMFERLGVRAVAPLLAHAASSTQMPWVHDEAKRGLGSEVFAQVADAFVPGSKWRPIEADFERALAALPNAPRRRVYLLEPASMAFSAREGSLSWLGGPPLGIRKADIPESSGGEPQRLVLTLDLADVPELAARHPDAQAIALFCPALEGGNADDATWITVARGAGSRGGPASSGTALAVRGFDVPSVVFTAPEHELGSEARAALDRVRHASAHIFGQPFWIHRERGADDGFWMQVDDALVGGEFPFDALFLFPDGVVVAEVQ